MKLVSVNKSDKPAKKFVATFDNNGRTKKTYFGDATMEDYTQHHDAQRRENYRSRHQKDLTTHDPSRAGYLSYYILWGNKSNFKDNLADYRRRFGL